MSEIIEYYLDLEIYGYDYDYDQGYYEEKFEIKEDGTYICLECGKIGIIRANSKTGEKFIGCSGFPKCKNTDDYWEEDIK